MVLAPPPPSHCVLWRTPSEAGGPTSKNSAPFPAFFLCFPPPRTSRYSSSLSRASKRRKGRVHVCVVVRRFPICGCAVNLFDISLSHNWVSLSRCTSLTNLRLPSDASCATTNVNCRHSTQTNGRRTDGWIDRRAGGRNTYISVISICVLLLSSKGCGDARDAITNSQRILFIPKRDVKASL